MKSKTPAAASGNRGHETLPGGFDGSFITASYRTQIIASRYALPFETAAIIAALAFGGTAHG